jgi:cathepsin L
MHSTTVVIALVLSIAAVSGAAPKWDRLTAGYSFAQYAADHGKGYSVGEYAARAAIFARNLAAVVAHNAGGAASHKMGVNALTDRTPAELKRMAGYRAMPAVQRELRAQAHVKPHVVSGKPLPPSVDYRTSVPAVLTGVKNQGQCGSCWAHSATETLESHWAIATGDLYVLSQQQLASCAPNPKHCGGSGGCEGSVPEIAYEYLMSSNQTTLASTWDYPYESFSGEDFQCKMNANSTLGTEVHIKGYYTVPGNQQAIMDALAFAGPLSIVVDAHAWSPYESGIFDGCNYTAGVSLDHVVQLVGYGTDADLGKDYWVVRNSWGPAWGEHGYIRLIKHKVAECGTIDVDGFCDGNKLTAKACGQCGFMFDALYPYVSPAPVGPVGPAVKVTMYKPNDGIQKCNLAVAGTRELQVKKCTGQGQSNWFDVTTVHISYFEHAVYFNGNCSGQPDDALFRGQCDVMQEAYGKDTGSYFKVTGCTTSAPTLHTDCTAAGMCSTSAPVVAHQCVKLEAWASMTIGSFVTAASSLTESLFKNSDCSGSALRQQSFPCGVCTAAGIFHC